MMASSNFNSAVFGNPRLMAALKMIRREEISPADSQSKLSGSKEHGNYNSEMLE